MKYLKNVLTITLALVFSAVFAQPEKTWETGGFKTPESVYYHAGMDILFVSNINGKPTNKDMNGFISKMDTDGNIIEMKWAEGLHAPKGMIATDDYLYVTDIDHIVRININTGEIAKKIHVEGSSFLNDMEGYKGRIFISDMNENKIYMLEDDEVSVFKEEGLTGANGLYETDGILYSGNTNYVLQFDLETGEEGKTKAEVGGIDGLKEYDKETFLTSDWKGNVYKVNRAGQTKLILSTEGKNIQAADFEYITDEKELIIPTFFHNTVAAYRLQ